MIVQALGRVAIRRGDDGGGEPEEHLREELPAERRERLLGKPPIEQSCRGQAVDDAIDAPFALALHAEVGSLQRGSVRSSPT